MNVPVDQWTPLFDDLANQLSESRRTDLMQEIGLQLKDSALTNFGESAPGDMRPWHDELLVSKSYRQKVGRAFATLDRSEYERLRTGGSGPHLKDSFEIRADGKSVTMENTSPYASEHQDGEGVPRRPFFPVDENGELMPFMWQRIRWVLDVHFLIGL